MASESIGNPVGRELRPHRARRLSFARERIRAVARDLWRPMGRFARSAASLQSLLMVAGLLLFNVPFASAELQEGKPAPAVRADLLGGGRFDSESQRGKVIVLNFWASWCKPCREEMPALDSFYRAHRAEGLEVIAISIEGPRDLAKVTDAMKRYSFPAALASGAETQGYGRPWRVPITFVIDRRGVLRFDGWKFAKKLDLPALDRIVVPLLREPRGSGLAESGLVQEVQLAGQAR
jgi:cytochrome c biogenesis protein CcmG/thiol:disulfide interchange protein DsbE